jgi:type I restriction enzyme S subunit
MLTKAPIKHFAKVGSGQGAPQRETDFSETGIPFIRAGSLEDLLNGRGETDLLKVNEEIAKEYRLKLYQPNTIVFAKSGMSALKGRIYKLKNPCYVVNHLATLELNENANPDYVIHTLRYFSPVKLINDNAYPSLKQSIIENYEVPFPKDKDHQLHIANILTKSENLIAQRKESIRLLDEFLKSTFLEMFGDAVKNEKKWKKSDLKNYAKVRIGPFGSLLHRDDYVTNGVPLVNPSHISAGKIIVDSELTISSKKMTELSAYVMHEGDVVLGRRGEIGRCAVVTRKEDGFLCGTGSIFIRPTENLNPIFLYNIISSASMRKNLENYAKGITMKNLNSGIIENLKIPVPPIELQTQFAQIVGKTEALKSQYQQSLQELENLYGSLSQKAFKGELGVKQNNSATV